MSWPEIALGEICRPKQHKTIPSSELLDDGFVVYGANGPIGYYSDFTHDKMTIAVTCRGATCGTINVVPPKSYITGNAMALDDLDDSKVVLSFLRYALEHKGFASVINGAAQPQITRAPLLTYTIPLPPLSEQKRIAGILDQADALRRLRTQALEKLNTLGQAIFHEMFGDLADKRVEKLADIAQLINGDRSSNYPSGDDLKDDGVLFLSTKNIRDWRLALDKILHISEEKFASLSRGKLQRGDLVITLRGTLGQAAIFDCDFETGFINAQMMIIRPESGISSQYLLDFLSLDSTQQELNKGQSGSAVKQLTAKQVGELPVVIPSEIQQSEYGARIAEHQKSRLASKAQLQACETLFTSLQHRAFRGEL